MTVEQLRQGYDALAPEVRERWALEQVQTIRNTVAKDLSVPEFQMGLAVAARYGLDPLLHEIWFAKSPGRDGQPGRTMIMTGRDGFLKVARNRPDYRGMRCDVVREKDDFRVSWAADGSQTVEHSYVGADDARGPIKGAWCVVEFDGKRPFYYYAPLSEYMPRTENARKYSPWGSQTSVMILKATQSYALRISCGISGMVGAEEAERAFEAQREPDDAPAPDLAAVMAEIPADLRDRLYAAYSDAATLRPGQITPAALQMSVKGQPPARIEAYVAAVEAANARARQDAEDEAPADAEVVPDDEDLGGGSATGAPPFAPDTATDDRPPGRLGPRGPVARESEAVALRGRLDALKERLAEAEASGSDMAVEVLGEEIGLVETQLRAAEDAAQERLV